MTSGFYAACAGLMARTRALELTAHNLANTRTSGYKAQRETFQSLIAGSADARLSPLNAAVNDFGVLGRSRLDLTQGSFEETGNDLDLALDGQGFFAVQTPAGPRYTRAGQMRLAADGTLTNADGHAVIGENGPVRLPRGKVSFSPEGLISVDGALAARLKVVEFAPGTEIKAEGSMYVSAPEGTERKASGATVRQGWLESSNVDPLGAAVGLITIQRQAETMQRAMTMFHSEFNRIAAEELPRV